MTETEFYAAVADDFATLLGGLSADELALSSPCEGWTVENVVGHVISGNWRFSAILRREAVPEPTYNVAGEPAAAFVESRAAFWEAVQAPDVLGQEFEFIGRMLSGSTLVSMRANELLVHGWDVARATGRTPPFSDELVEEGIVSARKILGGRPREAGGRWAPEEEVAETAPPLDRLAAFTGRKP